MTPLNTRDPAVVTVNHLTAALGCSTGSINQYMLLGKIPQPDVRGRSNQKFWRLSTIRAWRPDVADIVSELIRLLPRQPMLNAAA
mgnify:CR=1 FL=1|jgi:hypothetical protein